MAFTGISTARSEDTVDRLLSTTTMGLDWLDFKEDLVTAGWQVLGSGDGLALYELTGVTGGAGTGPGGVYDVFTQSGTGAGGWNASAGGGTWWYMQTPADADVVRYFVFAVGDNGVNNFRWITSKTPFTGGSALTRPTSVDEAMLMGDPTTQAGRNVNPSGTGNKCHWIIGDKEEEYGFLFITVRSSTTNSDVHFIIGYDQCVDVWEGTNPPSTIDPDPHYMIACSTTNSGNSESYFDGNNEIDGLFDPAGTTGRLEDLVAGTRTAKVCAYLWGGEVSPVLPAGHYVGVFWFTRDNDDRLGTTAAGGREDISGYNGFVQQVANVRMIGRNTADSVWIKGLPRGRLITASYPFAAEPILTRIDGRAMVAWGYVAIAWHETKGWQR